MHSLKGVTQNLDNRVEYNGLPDESFVDSLISETYNIERRRKGCPGKIVKYEDDVNSMYSAINSSDKCSGKLCESEKGTIGCLSFSSPKEASTHLPPKTKNCKDSCCENETSIMKDKCQIACSSTEKGAEVESEVNAIFAANLSISVQTKSRSECSFSDENLPLTKMKRDDEPTGQDGSLQKRSNVACATHLEQALKEYSLLIELGKCICREFIHRLDRCCGIATKNSKKQRFKGIHTARDECDDPKKSSCSKVCCEKEVSSDLGNPSDCPLKEIKRDNDTSSLKKRKRKKIADLEEESARQHVRLNVAGMTCTGCARKLSRVLENIDGVSSIHVTFVTGVADFDFDTDVWDLKDITSRIQKETGFKISTIKKNSQTLDLKIDPLKVKIYEKLEGLVLSVERINKLVYRVYYDPTIIGARAIVSRLPSSSLAELSSDSSLVDNRKRLLGKLWQTIACAILTIPVLVLEFSNTLPYSKRSIISLVLGTLVQSIAVPEFYIPAIKSLLYSRVLEMDLLIAISLTAAYGYSVIAFILTHVGYKLETESFFETSTLLITLVFFGRFLTTLTKFKVVSAICLRSFQAEVAILLESSDKTREIDARLLELGDVFIVRAHCRVVTDGEVIGGQSMADESMLTGERLPAPKVAGDVVFAGTINGPGTLKVKASRLPGKNSVSDITDLVENALAEKPRIQDVTDAVAGYFIPVIFTVSLIVFIIWVAVNLRIRDKSAGGAIASALTYGIAVLAISCPCALGLAVPMVLIVAGGVSARKGVIIRKSSILENGCQITDVVFDKTGTLTKDDLEVCKKMIFSSNIVSETDALSLVKALTKDNEHPISAAVSAYLNFNLKLFEVKETQSFPGSGIQCRWKGFDIKFGNPYWLKVDKQAEVAGFLEEGFSLVCLSVECELVAIFCLKSNIRDDATTVVEELQRKNITCHILTGDNPQVAEDVARAAGILSSNVRARCSPSGKQIYVKNLIKNNRKVLFCGDGTNDAIAIAQSHVGIQIGSASDVTRATADVILLGGLDGILEFLSISERSIHRIIFNFVWSFVYNIFAILLASGAFVKFHIAPAYAGIGEVVSVAPVIFAALSLWTGSKKQKV
ncbi:uncharacterized protein PRCAT00004126001 [Priceomyces carsonii]|uniref:uncharacterized protein n=1 Tax=Priceomyces carsonii TaxID=28549 RepID=UPI002ED80B82|nr:unnamed protein product [Priceomyces carsonii]